MRWALHPPETPAELAGERPSFRPPPEHLRRQERRHLQRRPVRAPSAAPRPTTPTRNRRLRPEPPMSTTTGPRMERVVAQHLSAAHHHQDGEPPTNHQS